MKGKLDKGICKSVTNTGQAKLQILRHKKAHKKKPHGEIEEEKSDDEQTGERGINEIMYAKGTVTLNAYKYTIFSGYILNE